MIHQSTVQRSIVFISRLIWHVHLTTIIMGYLRVSHVMPYLSYKQECVCLFEVDIALDGELWSFAAWMELFLAFNVQFTSWAVILRFLKKLWREAILFIPLKYQKLHIIHKGSCNLLVPKSIPVQLLCNFQLLFKSIDFAIF